MDEPAVSVRRVAYSLKINFQGRTFCAWFKNASKNAVLKTRRNTEASYIRARSGSQESPNAEWHLIRVFISQDSLNWKISAALHGRGWAGGWGWAAADDSQTDASVASY